MLFKLQFTVWPEMLSFPYMVNKGFLIYKDFHHVYQPLMTFILLGYFKIFGFSPVALKLFGWALMLLVDVVIFITSNQLFKNKWVPLFPVGLYVLMQPLFEGNMVWYDMAMTLPMLLSVYFVLKWSSRKQIKNIFFSGFFLAVACLIKQQAVLAAFPVLIYILYKKISWKEFWTLILGGLIPLSMVLLFLVYTGDFNDYIFWTFQFPLLWLPKFPGYKVFPAKKEFLIIALMVLLPIPGILKGIFSKKFDTNTLLVYGIFLTSLVSAFPRFSFFHLQPFLAFFVIAFTTLITNRNNLFLIITFALLSYIIFYRWRMIIPEFNGGMRFYGAEEQKISEYLDSITTANDKVYLLGPHSAIYVYANRVPPKPWIESYVWHFEIPGLQEKVISGWEKDPPKVILWSQPQPGNWFDLGTYQPKKISDWINKNYIMKDKIESNVGVWYKKNI